MAKLFDTTIIGDVTLNGYFDITGDVSIDGNASITGGLTVENDIQVGGASVNSLSVMQEASQHAGLGYGVAPWLYANAVEAQDEGGGSSTAVLIGNTGPGNPTTSDEIAWVTNGNASLIQRGNGAVDVLNGTLSEQGNQVATQTWVSSNTTSNIAGTDIAPGSLEVQDWNVIDVAQHGYPGDRSGGDLTTLFDANPNSLFILHPGATYEMSTYTNANYQFFGMVCPTAGNRPRIYPAEPSRSGPKDGTQTAQQVEFLELGDHGTTNNGGATLLKNIVFHNDATRTSAEGWRYDCGLLKGIFHEDARFINIKYEGARHKNEPDPSISGDTAVLETGDYWEHGSRYQIRAEGATDEANIVFDGLQMPDGGTEEDEAAIGAATDHAIGFAVETHYGQLTVKNSYLRGFVDNGLYVTFTSGDGRVSVQGTHLENNSNSNLRIGPNTEVRNCRITLENTNNNIYQGIGLHAQDPDGQTVDGLVIDSVNHGNDVVRINKKTNFAKFSNVEITNDTSNRVVEFDSPADTPNGKVVLDHWKVQDSGGDGSYNSFMEFDNKRDDVIIKDSRLHSSTRGCIRARGTLKVENCNFYTGTNYPALRIGAYDPSTDPGQNSTIKFHDNKIAYGNGVALEPYAVVGTLDIQRNNFSEATNVFGAPSASFDGDVVDFVCKNNVGYIAGEKPDSLWVRGRLDTDSPTPVRDRPTPFAHTHQGDMVYNTNTDETIKNVGWAWQNTRNNNLSGTIEDGEYGNMSAWTTQTNMSISSAQIHNANNSILFDGLNNTSGHNVSQLGDGLNHYPKKGDKFRLFFYLTSLDTVQFYFACQSVGNGSEAFTFTVDPGTNDLTLQEKGSSGSATLIDQPVTNGWTTNQWYQLQCSWYDNGSDQIYAILRDNSGTELASDTGTLTIYPERKTGGVGTFIGGSARVFMDDWRLLAN